MIKKGEVLQGMSPSRDGGTTVADVTGTVQRRNKGKRAGLRDSSREASDNISWDIHLVIAPIPKHVFVVF